MLICGLEGRGHFVLGGLLLRSGEDVAEVDGVALEVLGLDRVVTALADLEVLSAGCCVDDLQELFELVDALPEDDPVLLLGEARDAAHEVPVRASALPGEVPGQDQVDGGLLGVHRGLTTGAEHEAELPLHVLERTPSGGRHLLVPDVGDEESVVEGVAPVLERLHHVLRVEDDEREPSHVRESLGEFSGVGAVEPLTELLLDVCAVQVGKVHFYSLCWATTLWH